MGVQRHHRVQRVPGLGYTKGGAQASRLLAEDLALDAAHELDVLLHEGLAAAVQLEHHGALQRADGVGLSGLLDGRKGGALEAARLLERAKVGAHKALERGLLQEQTTALLDLADLAESHGARLELALAALARLARGLGGLLRRLGLWRLAACGLLRGRLCARHFGWGGSQRKRMEIAIKYRN